MEPVRDMMVLLHGPAPQSVTLDGAPVDFTATEDGVVWPLPAAVHESGDAVYRIVF